jgi:hypothetical protein
MEIVDDLLRTHAQDRARMPTTVSLSPRVTVPAQYAVLESGIVSKAELDLHGKPGGRFATPIMVSREVRHPPVNSGVV